MSARAGVPGWSDIRGWARRRSHRGRGQAKGGAKRRASTDREQGPKSDPEEQPRCRIQSEQEGGIGDTEQSQLFHNILLQKEQRNGVEADRGSELKRLIFQDGRNQE